MTKNILIIDDSLTAQEINKRCVEIVCQEYFENQYFFCNNGQDALALLKKQTVDLILCDIVMPVMNGEALATALNQIPMLSKIPFITITSKLDNQTIASLQANGVDYIIRKPISPIKVRDALTSIHFIEVEETEYEIKEE